jgi:hypothetical protein
MKYLSRIFSLLIFSILLAGCATVSSDSLGIPQSEWNQYSPEKRAELTHQYKQTQTAKRTQLVKSGHSTLQVGMQGGKVLMPPYSSLQAYQPVSFEIKEGECHREVSVSSKLNPKQKTIMTACYTEYTLYLDASPYETDKAYGSILLRYMPLWKRGFTYPGVSSTGLVKLTDGSITVKEIAS